VKKRFAWEKSVAVSQISQVIDVESASKRQQRLRVCLMFLRVISTIGGSVLRLVISFFSALALFYVVYLVGLYFWP